jgi:sugar/nucleoside kinase (ribokinase family)
MTVTSSAGLDIIAFGDLNPDVVVADSDPVPRFGQAERLVDAIRIGIGGSAAIFAAAAARLGAATALVTTVGDDAAGSSMRDALEHRGVDTSACSISSTLPTNVSVILSGPTDRAIMTSPGALAAVRGDDVTDELLRRARHLHVASLFLLPASSEVGRLAARARAAGLTISLDTNWDPTEQWRGVDELLPTIDVLLPNEQEARAIARLDDVHAAAARLSARGPLVVVKLGADGACAYQAGTEVARTPARPVRVVDTTGAGDVFDAAFLGAWLDGEPIDDALAWAAAAGSLSTTGHGTDAHPTREAVAAFLAS